MRDEITVSQTSPQWMALLNIAHNLGPSGQEMVHVRPDGISSTESVGGTFDVTARENSKALFRMSTDVMDDITMPLGSVSVAVQSSELFFTALCAALTGHYKKDVTPCPTLAGNYKPSKPQANASTIACWPSGHDCDGWRPLIPGDFVLTIRCIAQMNDSIPDSEKELRTFTYLWQSAKDYLRHSPDLVDRTAKLVNLKGKELQEGAIDEVYRSCGVQADLVASE